MNVFIDSQLYMTVFWAICFVVFLGLEIATATALVTIWLALGSFVAMFFAIAHLPFWVQCTVFIVVSAVLLIFTRPAVKKLLTKTQPTNFELDVGKSATVIETINNDSGEGRVILDGTYWTARSQDGRIIEKDTVVTVVKVDGAKLIVK